MNRVILMGRLTKDPEVRQSQGENATLIARYTLAVDRRGGKQDQNGNRPADFISCVAFGHQAEFADKYLRKGQRTCVSGRIQTGSYTKADGSKVYTSDVIIEEQEFADGKRDTGARDEYYDQMAAAMNGSAMGFNDGGGSQAEGAPDGFMNIPAEIDEELPFS